MKLKYICSVENSKTFGNGSLQFKTRQNQKVEGRIIFYCLEKFSGDNSTESRFKIVLQHNKCSEIKDVPYSIMH